MTMKLAVVVVRNLSAGWIGAYGNEWVATPHLDRLAADGIVFERHFARRLKSQSHPYADRGIVFDDLVPPWSIPVDLFAVYAEEFAGLQPVTDPPMGSIEPEDWDGWNANRCSFAAMLTRLDAKLGRVFDEYRSEALSIVLTSDQGFPLGEHGIVGQLESRPYEEFVHLPLIVSLPNREYAGHRVDAMTQPEDLKPICEAVRLLGLSTGDHSAKGELLDMHWRDEAVSYSPNGWQSIRTSEWTCLLPSTAVGDTQPTAQLFRMPDDRQEVNDIADRMPELVEMLSKRFT